jgi:hypothetical protein
MTSRLLQLTGYSDDTDLVIVCNQSTVFEGSIGSIGSDSQIDTLAQWQQDIDLSQSQSQILQIEIRCTGGSLHCVDVLINEMLPQWLLKDNLSWPRFQPTADDIITDLNNMVDAGLFDKYALSRQQLRDCLEMSDTGVPSGNFIQPYNTNDGRTNVKIDGVAQTPTRTDIFQGPWHWFLGSGQVLTFDLVVDR